MGNCCGCLEADEQQERVSSKNAFQGEVSSNLCLNLQMKRLFRPHRMDFVYLCAGLV